LLESGTRAGCAREQEATAGIGIEAMHGGRRAPETAAQLVRPRCEGVASTARRIDRQACRLVEHDRFSVDEDYSVGQHRNAMNETVAEGKSSPF